MADTDIKAPRDESEPDEVAPPHPEPIPVGAMSKIDNVSDPKHPTVTQVKWLNDQNQSGGVVSDGVDRQAEADKKAQAAAKADAEALAAAKAEEDDGSALTGAADPDTAAVPPTGTKPKTK